MTDIQKNDTRKLVPENGTCFRYQFSGSKITAARNKDVRWK